eukprot:8687886-Ditylum_brightwellii.AAC.1
MHNARGSTLKSRCGKEAARACDRQAQDCKWCDMRAVVQDCKQHNMCAVATKRNVQVRICEKQAREEDSKWCKMCAAAKEDQRKHEEHVMARVCERQAFVEIERMRESKAKGEKMRELTCNSGPKVETIEQTRMTHLLKAV